MSTHNVCQCQYLHIHKLYHVRLELSLINIFRHRISGMFHPRETGCNGHVPEHGNDDKNVKHHMAVRLNVSAGT